MKNRFFQRIAAGALVAALALGVAPSLTAAQGAKPDENTIVVAQTVDVGSLDPTVANSRAEANVLNHMFGTLYKVEVDGSIVPYLAESSEVAADGKKVTFKIRQGLKCSNGEDLNAEDVVYTFERTYDPANKFTGNVQFVANAIGYDGVELIDANTMAVKLKDRSPIVLGLLAEIYVLCKDHYGALSIEEAAQKPVSSGPYVFVEQKKDDYLLMEKRADFNIFPVGFQRIYWRTIPEASTRVAELLAGNVDVVTNVPVDQLDVVRNSGSAQVQAVAGTRRIYVGFHLGEKYKDAPGRDAIAKTEVRVALQYAIDVPTICTTLLGTDCERASSMVNPPNNNPNLTAYPYDPKKAEELLDAAGYPRGADGWRFAITFQGPRGRYLNDANVVQAIGQYLQEVGVNVTVEVIDWAEYRTKAPTHDIGPMFFLGTGGSVWSAWYDMADLSVPGAEGATNYTEWTNPKWFELRKSFSETTDAAKQREIVNEMLKVMYEDPPWLFLYFQPDFYGSSNRVEWQARRDEKVFVYTAALKK
jgi:peptide/nickel transport system substrate-binding protein